MVGTFSTQWSILFCSFLLGTSFFHGGILPTPPSLDIPSQQSINKKLPPPTLERHVGERKPGKASSHNQRRCWGYGATQVTCYKEIIHSRWPREDPPQKKSCYKATFVSHGIFTCVILLHYWLYQLLSPVCPSTVCQGSSFFGCAERRWNLKPSSALKFCKIVGCT